MKLALSVVLAMALTVQAAYCDLAVLPSYSDVAYASLSKSQVCNVYLPASATNIPCPAIVVVHRGESAGAYLSVMTKLTPDAEALNGDLSDYMAAAFYTDENLDAVFAFLGAE